MIDAMPAANNIVFSREHSDPHALGRAPLQVDRQRIVHSAAFRRLQYKTQVFVALEGDHFRTRLTHTLEVADLSRVLADALALDADLAEAIALAHDLGHSPFGHAGERALDECLREHGGFEHNAHALRVVDYLEHPYPEFRGLNLTRVVRESLAKHTTHYDQPGAHPLQDGRPPPPEGQVAALADSLAYALHDLQDGLYAGLIPPAALDELELWRGAYEGPAVEQGDDWRRHLRPAIDRMQHTLVQDAAAASLQAAATAPAGGGSAPALVRLSSAMERHIRALDSFLRTRVYRNQRLVRMDMKARRIITALFAEYVAEPRLMPPRYAKRVAEQGAARVAGDYIAGMTDRFAIREHGRLFDPRIEP